ncbi:hypothetical protein Tco_1221364 [Tanacetum coccineum]
MSLTHLKGLPFQKRKLELEKNKAKTKVALLSAQPSFPNVTHLIELLLLGDLKDIPPELEEFTKTIASPTSQVAELKPLQSELPNKFLSVPTLIEMVLARLKTLDALLSLLNKLFQRKPPKDANQNKQQSIPTPPITTTTTLTTSLQSSFIPSPPKSSSQTEGEHIKIDKGKKVVSSKDAKEESSNSEFDDTINLTGSRVESSRTKKLNKFDFITEDRDHVHLTEDKIQEQKRIEESVKAEAAKHEVEVRKEELVAFLGLDVVSKYYKAKLQYDKYCDKMRNRRAKFRITNCNVLTRKGPISLKVYIEDSTS